MVTYETLIHRRDRIAVVGLGYVGLPLAVHLAAHFDVLGFDVKASRVAELQQGQDSTREVTSEMLAKADIEFSADSAMLGQCRLIIVAVPTPIDETRRPDLTPMIAAATTVGRHLKAGACVVFESTVYPGATEETCVPMLAKNSGLEYGIDFTVGYSPERINPGDKVHTVDKIIKVVAGSDPATTEMLAQVYGQIVTAGIHKASSIKVAEAAKVIENTQRDLNIALMNELAMIFDKVGIDTLEVLAAAGTKWNFLPFRPGLVGGHCIGVDPYYLTHKAQALGYLPEVILAGRRINDNMGKYVAERMVKLLIAEGHAVRNAKIAILGLTFKENVPDLRNTRVVDIVDELKDYGVQVLVCDPLADPSEAKRYYGIELQRLEELPPVDGVIVAVQHNDYLALELEGVSRLCGGKPPIVIDLKGIFEPPTDTDPTIRYWRL